MWLLIVFYHKYNPSNNCVKFEYLHRFNHVFVCVKLYQLYLKRVYIQATWHFVEIHGNIRVFKNDKKWNGKFYLHLHWFNCVCACVKFYQLYLKRVYLQATWLFVQIHGNTKVFKNDKKWSGKFYPYLVMQIKETL